MGDALCNFPLSLKTRLEFDNSLKELTRLNTRLYSWLSFVIEKDRKENQQKKQGIKRKVRHMFQVLPPLG
jgi:hypothetical protein